MNRKTSGACIAAMLSFGAVAFAQTTGQTPPQTPQTPQTRSESQQGRDQQVTLVGCIQRESDYRQAHEQGRGGAMGSGMGVGNEFVLVNATMGSGSESSASGAMSGTTSGTTASGTTSGTAASGTAGTTGSATGTMSAGSSSMGGGTAYALTGDRESELEKYVGQRVEIVGKIEDGAQASASGRAGTSGSGATGSATTGTATSGTGTSGSGASGAGASASASFSDLKEIDITSFRAVGGTCPGR